MSLPTFLLPSAKGSNLKSVFKIITVSAISIKGVYSARCSGFGS